MSVTDVMQVATFIIGIVLVAFALYMVMKGTAIKKALPLIVFGSVLLVCGLFAPRLKSLKVSGDGLELSLDEIKAAAIQAVDHNPQLAGEISGEKGVKAVEETKTAIREAKTEEELRKILKVERSSDTVTFSPATGKIKNIYPVLIRNRKFKPQDAIAIVGRRERND